MSNFVSKFTSLILLVAVSLVPAWAQYGGGNGTMSGSSGAPGTYTPPKSGYGGKGAAIGIGVGAAAGVGIAYWALHNRPNMVGCVQNASQGAAILNEKDGKLYPLQPDSEMALKPGERVALKGKKIETSSGKESFRVTKVVKDYGACEVSAENVGPAANTSASNIRKTVRAGDLAGARTRPE